MVGLSALPWREKHNAGIPCYDSFRHSLDDGLALNTLKTLKATDQAGDLILESGDQIEDEARAAAPGSAPFLTAAAMAANVQSQAMMQKMPAAMLRQEAARIAHENALRKRHGILTVKVRQSISESISGGAERPEIAYFPRLIPTRSENPPKKL
jgi:hypothetical protein